MCQDILEPTDISTRNRLIHFESYSDNNMQQLGGVLKWSYVVLVSCFEVRHLLQCLGDWTNMSLVLRHQSNKYDMD